MSNTPYLQHDGASYSLAIAKSDQTPHDISFTLTRVQPIESFMGKYNVPEGQNTDRFLAFANNANWSILNKSEVSKRACSFK